MSHLPLFLNDIAGSEILLILVFILMFFGSKSIPGIARTMGRTFRQIKDASAELQNEIKKSGADMKKDLNLTGIIEETTRDIQRPLDQFSADVEDVMSRRPTHSRSQATLDIPVEKPEVEVVSEATVVIEPNQSSKE